MYNTFTLWYNVLAIPAKLLFSRKGIKLDRVQAFCRYLPNDQNFLSHISCFQHKMLVTCIILETKNLVFFIEPTCFISNAITEFKSVVSKQGHWYILNLIRHIILFKVSRKCHKQCFRCAGMRLFEAFLYS